MLECIPPDFWNALGFALIIIAVGAAYRLAGQ